MTPRNSVRGVEPSSSNGTIESLENLNNELSSSAKNLKESVTNQPSDRIREIVFCQEVLIKQLKQDLLAAKAFHD